LSARTGLPDSHDELGHLAKYLTAWRILQQRIKEREKLAVFAQLNPNAAMEFSADGSLVYSMMLPKNFSQSVAKEHPREILPVRTDEIIHDCLASGPSRSIWKPK